MREGRLKKDYEFLSEELTVVEKPVSVYLEVAKYIKAANGRPILFENVTLRDGRPSKYKVIANVVGSRGLVAKYFNVGKNELLPYLVNAINNRRRPSVVEPVEYRSVTVNLYDLPILHHYPGDGGHYITSSIVVANDPEYGLNASFHRMMVIGRDEVVVRIVPRHLHYYIERGLKEVAVCIGNKPEVLIASALSPELGISELDIANALKETQLVNFDGIIGTCAEIVMIAEVTDRYHEEGPIVDVTETYDIVRMQRVFKIRRIYVKEDAYYHAILPGDREHKVLMGLSREPMIYMEVNKAGVECKDVYLTEGGCSWLHCVIQIKKRTQDDGRKAIEAAFRAHKSLKLAVVVDDDIDIYNPEEVEWAMATRVQPDKSVYVYPDQIGSSMDPSADRVTRKTAKWGIDATIPDLSRSRDFLKAKI